jgi:hypothetical protein
MMLGLIASGSPLYILGFFTIAWFSADEGHRVIVDSRHLSDFLPILN